MRYLRKFNENSEPKWLTGSKKLRNIVENYLVDLLDDGLEVELELGDIEDCYTVFLSKYGSGFYWNDIKDYFIPFLTFFIEEYDIIVNVDSPGVRFSFSLVAGTSWKSAEYYKIDDILNDKININDKLVAISFNVKEKSPN